MSETSQPTWAADYDVTVTDVERILRSECGLRPKTLEILGEGWDNVAWLIDSRWVFRFPRRAVAVGFLRNEIDTLPRLRGLSLEIPLLRFASHASGVNGRPYVGYERLVGSPAAESNLNQAKLHAMAAPLGRFLRELHSIRLGPELETHLANGQEWRTDAPSRWRKARTALAAKPEFVAQTRLDLESVTRVAEGITYPISERRLVHGDFYSLHLLLSPAGRLTGVIDWGDVHFGAVSVDLAIAFGFLPRSALPEFERAYGAIDQDSRRAAAFHAFCHASLLGEYAVSQKRPLLEETARRCLLQAAEHLMAF